MTQICTMPSCYSQRVGGSTLCNTHHNAKHGVLPPVISDCANDGCRQKATHGKLFCDACSKSIQDRLPQHLVGKNPTVPAEPKNEFHDRRQDDQRMSFKYPKYYKPIPAGMTEMDIYAMCMIFQVQDYSGALHHAIKKILLPGVRTGGKTRRDDIKEARDTLTRWLELHK